MLLGPRVPLILALTLCCSCSDYGKQETEVKARQSTPEVQLANFGLSLAQKNASDFSQAANQLTISLQNLCSHVEVPGALVSVTYAYEKLVEKFYLLQGFAIGLQKADTDQSPLNAIHYRTLNRCLVDTLVVETKNKQPLSPTHPSVLGLYAIEYLLFEKTLVSHCNIKAYPQMEIWNQIPDTEKKRDRCLHAQTLAKQINHFAQKIKNDWDPQSASYEQNLNTLEYTKSETLALKNMVQALSALEKVKDYDLGKPLGLNSLCTNESGKCPEDVQHPYSQLSLVAVISSLKAFQNFFNGTDPEDFSVSAYLRAKKQYDLDLRINTLISQALATSIKLNQVSTLSQLVENMNPISCKKTTLSEPNEPVCFLFKQVEHITDVYKSDLLTFLSLEIDQSIPQGDND